MTTMMQRPTLHDLVKEAMEGTASKVDISMEAARQLANVGVPVAESTKTASAAQGIESVPTEYIQKLAGALDFMVKQAESGAKNLPGTGPGALQVFETSNTERNIDANQQGQSRAQVPSTPPMQSSGVAKDPANAMQTNDEMMHGEQPADPMHNEKKAAALFKKNLEALGKKKKEASSLFERNLEALGLRKVAEDAINPASISTGKTQTGATPPEGASASEEQVPSEPSDVKKQKGLVSSNQSAIDYTKREAKADPKSDAGHVLDEPAQSALTDQTLNKTLDHAQEAGAKIASDALRTMAARTVLAKLAEEAAAKAKSKGKEKDSNAMMGYPGDSGLSTPAGQSGFTAGSV